MFTAECLDGVSFLDVPCPYPSRRKGVRGAHATLKRKRKKSYFYRRNKRHTKKKKTHT